METVTVSISVDTEEDDWAAYRENGASTRNIIHLGELQDLFDQWGARPTYLVNRPPLLDRKSIEVLGDLASRESVEIGAHCHPWNTPPSTGGGEERSMMCGLSAEANRGKIREITGLLRKELGVRPTTFRAGRWGFGPSVAAPLVEEGYEIDCSVTPFIDWSAQGGPDYTEAPHRPYRFHPSDPLRPDAGGSLLQLPATIGFLGGDERRAARRRQRLEAFLGRTGVVGVLDRAGFLARRWLSPETSTGRTMIGLAESWIRSGEPFLHATFHSSALLPGATPFVRSEEDRARLLQRLADFLTFCKASGFVFRTLLEAGSAFPPHRGQSVRVG